jgi:hypothetical protein
MAFRQPHARCSKKCVFEGCRLDVQGLEFLDSAPSFADTAVQDSEAVDSTEVPSATLVPSNLIAARRMAQRCCARRRQVADIQGLFADESPRRAGTSACGEKDGRLTGEIILPVDFLATLGVAGESRQSNGSLD